ncbi:MAG TPA: DUF192 domain-containing protein [Acidimicrobiia bacterium]|nr:DUF192 domain-containing protein [Acidimicrobiia bacterium]
MRDDGWLLSATTGTVLASLEVAATRAERRRGLRGREEFDGALLLRPCRQVHTFGVRFPIDVAFCNLDGEVVRITTLAPRRVSRPALGAAFAIEAKAGSFARWQVSLGDTLEIT